MPRQKKEETEPSEPSVQVKSENRGRLIKYMGSSDIRRLLPGENLVFSVEPLKEMLEWNPQNGHTLNTADYHNVPKKFWDQLLRFEDWRDVTDEHHDPKKEVPRNRWQEMWGPESRRLWTPR